MTGPLSVIVLDTITGITGSGVTGGCELLPGSVVQKWLD
jgi:hypothetical protein